MGIGVYIPLVGLSCIARFDRQGNARAYILWNEQKVRLHVFHFVTFIKVMYNISFEAKDKKVNAYEKT